MLTVTWTVVSLLLAFSATCNSQVTCVNDCPANAYCLRLQSGRRWYCTCGAGYRLNVNRQCEDIDECSWNLCSRYWCVNSPGSYDCQSDGCGRGFVKRNGRCQDINECTTDVCGLWACQNYPGPYTCLDQCVAGYTRRSGRCEDLDECLDPDVCDRNADCVNVPGSFNCTCVTGFHGNGTNCTASHFTLSKLTDSPAPLAGVIIGGLVALFIVAFIVGLLVLRRKKRNRSLDKPASGSDDNNIQRNPDTRNHNYANVRMSNVVETGVDADQGDAIQHSENSAALYSNNLVKERKLKQRKGAGQQENSSYIDAPVYENDPKTGPSAMSYDTLWKSGATAQTEDTYNHLEQQSVLGPKKPEVKHSTDVYNHL